MKEKVAVYFNALERLSTAQLDRSTKDLVLRERKNLACVIAHIAEIWKRRVHLECGYKNLFEYCVRRLNLSEGSVYRMIQVAKVCREFPQVLVHLGEGRVSLTVASLLAPHLREDTVEKLLCDCARMTRREVEEYIVLLHPKPAFAPSIRKRPTRTAQYTVEQPSGRESGAPRNPPVPTAAQDLSGRSPAPEASTASRPLLEPASPESFNFRFSARRAFKEKLERFAEVVGIEQPEKHLEQILEKALEIALEKKDPARKRERRLKKEAKNTLKVSSPCPGDVAKKTEKSRAERSRYIPASVREEVVARAGYQCEYRGPGGTRCTQRTRLEVDHKGLFSNGGTHEKENLRALCGRHNRFLAEKVLGTEFIDAKIASRKAHAVCRQQ
jgi:hypothetical protein